MKSSALDLSRHFSLQIRTLKIFGVWFHIPYSVRNYRYWLSIIMKIFIGIAVFTIPTASQFIYCVKIILSGNTNIQEIAAIINLVVTELQASIKLLDLFLRRNIFFQLRKQLQSTEFQFNDMPQRAILERGITMSRKLFWAVTLGSAMDVMTHIIVTPGFNKFQNLPLKMDLIVFDVNKETYFAYVYVFQVLYKPPMVTTFAAIMSMFWAAMSCAISQLEVLIYNIENMKELIKATMAERQCNEHEAFQEVLKGFIRHHSAIIRFVHTIQEAFGGQMSATLIMDGIILCTTAVQILSIENPTRNVSEVTWVLAYLSILTGILFVDCYFGHSLTVKGLQVSTAVFSCPWMDVPTKMKKNIMLFLAKTQLPMSITAALQVPISLNTFTKVINWTYKVFAVMNQMKK